jgi:hypothetical protein
MQASAAQATWHVAVNVGNIAVCTNIRQNIVQNARSMSKFRVFRCLRALSGINFCVIVRQLLAVSNPKALSAFHLVTFVKSDSKRAAMTREAMFLGMNRPCCGALLDSFFPQ